MKPFTAARTAKRYVRVKGISLKSELKRVVDLILLRNQIALCLQVLSVRLELARAASRELVQQNIVHKLLQQAETAVQVSHFCSVCIL